MEIVRRPLLTGEFPEPLHMMPATGFLLLIEAVSEFCLLRPVRHQLGSDYFASAWDNIPYGSYLQGETPRSIQSKIKEIAEFTELGDFLDLPLNCYSTGMIMRLAFSIATSAHPEILLIDEIFSTGD